MTTIDKLITSIENLISKTSTGTDTTAEVIRIEGDTAYVHIPGGVPETPVKLTVSAKAGDTVQVRISGGKATITGNASAPPTDDTAADKAQGTANAAAKAAAAAAKAAAALRQYFWHVESGTEAGAHITEIPRADFEADPEHGGGNLFARSDGLAIRDGITELATFRSSGAQIGQDDSFNSVIDSNGFCIKNQDLVAAKIESNGINFYDTTSSSYTDSKPSASIKVEQVAGSDALEIYTGDNTSIYCNSGSDIRLNRYSIGTSGVDFLSGIQGFPGYVSMAGELGVQHVTFEVGAPVATQTGKALSLRTGSRELISSDLTGALTISAHDSPIGTVQTATQSTDISIANETRTAATSLTLSPGTWMITGLLSFASASTGRRWLGITEDGTTDTVDYVQQMPAAGGATRLEVSVVVQPTTDTTYYLTGWQAQTTPAALTIRGGKLTAVRIS